jgi:hypothetical protein
MVTKPAGPMDCLRVPRVEPKLKTVRFSWLIGNFDDGHLLARDRDAKADSAFVPAGLDCGKGRRLIHGPDVRQERGFVQVEKGAPSPGTPFDVRDWERIPEQKSVRNDGHPNDPSTIR